MEIIKPSLKAIIKAAAALNKGGVIVCPTDTVYGFLADATNKKAVEKIYRIKKRPRLKPLPLFVYSIKKAKELAEIDARQERILKQKWPGRYTFILKSEARNPKSETNSKFQNHKLSKLVKKDGKIALRIPDHKFLLALLKKINKPLAQTSANISGQPPLTKISDIISLVENCRTSEVPQILIIDGGDLKKSQPSQVFVLSETLTRLR